MSMEMEMAGRGTERQRDVIWATVEQCFGLFLVCCRIVILLGGSTDTLDFVIICCHPLVYQFYFCCCCCYCSAFAATAIVAIAVTTVIIVADYVWASWLLDPLYVLIACRPLACMAIGISFGFCKILFFQVYRNYLELARSLSPPLLPFSEGDEDIIWTYYNPFNTLWAGACLCSRMLIRIAKCEMLLQMLKKIIATTSDRRSLSVSRNQNKKFK